MRIFLPRGDPRWGRYSNKGDCPENAIPLWQVLNPFVLGLRNYERTLVAEEIAQADFVKPYIRESREGMLCVSVEKRKPFSWEVRGLRNRIYEFLSENFKARLSEAIQRKYGCKERYSVAV